MILLYYTLMYIESMAISPHILLIEVNPPFHSLVKLIREHTNFIGHLKETRFRFCWFFSIYFLVSVLFISVYFCFNLSIFLKLELRLLILPLLIGVVYIISLLELIFHSHKLWQSNIFDFVYFEVFLIFFFWYFFSSRVLLKVCFQLFKGFLSYFCYLFLVKSYGDLRIVIVWLYRMYEYTFFLKYFDHVYMRKRYMQSTGTCGG